MNMSRKKIDFYGNDVVPNEDHNLKSNVENLRLSVIVQGKKILEEIIKFLCEYKAVSLVDEKSNKSKDLLKQLEVMSS